MINRAQIAIGLVVLIVGITVYLCDRPADRVYFLDRAGVSEGLFPSSVHRLGTIGGSFPCFAHTFGFTLITAGLITQTRKGFLTVCLSWLLVDSALELGQRYEALAVALTPDWFAGIPFFENTKNYFRQGTFDGFDMAFIMAGAIIGYLVLVLTEHKRQIPG